jgi:hypothetical protein
MNAKDQNRNLTARLQRLRCDSRSLRCYAPPNSSHLRLDYSEMPILYSYSSPGEGNGGYRGRHGRTRDTFCSDTRCGRAELFVHFLARRRPAAWVVRAAGVPIIQRPLNHVPCAAASRINLREQTPDRQVEVSCRTHRVSGAGPGLGRRRDLLAAAARTQAHIFQLDWSLAVVVPVSKGALLEDQVQTRSNGCTPVTKRWAGRPRSVDEPTIDVTESHSSHAGSWVPWSW